jgi:hypothetical protein
MSVQTIARLKKAKELELKRARAQADLRFLAVDICGYDWMSGPWHDQIFDFIDERVDHPRVAVFTPRYSYKSRIECVEIVREILRNPEVSIALVHHKLDLARELVVEIGELFQKNEALRELLPANHTPGKRTTAFIKTSQGGEFRLPGTGRAKATLKGFSADQDLTGAHPDIIFMDDVISAKTIEYFNGVEGLRQWVRHTIVPLAGATGRIRVKGTRWSPEDWYSDIIEADSWEHINRAILEMEDGTPDEHKGKPIEIYVGDPQAEGGKRFLTMDDVIRYKEEMKSHFGGQMMNDPRPDGSRPWNENTCEHYISSSAVRRYLKKIVILTDPAPLGMDDKGRLVKPDGTKDYWATAVIGYLKSEKRTVRVLLDGSMSQSWGLDQGLQEIKRLMRKWNVKIVGIEEPLGAGANVGFYARALKDKFGEAERVMGHRCRPFKFKSTQKGKPPRIMDLAAMAGMRDADGDLDPLFVMCKDTCDKEFLKMFLTQARNWAGKDSIKHDDCLDVVAYCDDPALVDLIRLGTPISKMWENEPSRVAPPARKTRYCPA